MFQLFCLYGKGRFLFNIHASYTAHVDSFLPYPGVKPLIFFYHHNNTEKFINKINISYIFYYYNLSLIDEFGFFC